MYTSREIKQRKKLARIICTMLLFIVILVGGGIWLFIQNNDEFEAYREISTEKDAGELQEKIIDEQLPAAFLYYPKFDIKDLDDAIMEKVSESEKDMVDQNIVKMDYTSNMVLDQYINVILTSYTYKDEEQTSQTVTYFSYDKVHNKMLAIDDVLRGNYTSGLSALATDSSYTKEDLAMFQIGEESLSIYTDNIATQFAYEDIKNYMLLDNEAIPRNAPATGNTAQEHVVDPSKPMLAFTFDDGPNPVTTPRILDAFDAVGGRATFFMLGSRVDQSPETVKEVCNRGYEAANHSYSHQTLASDDKAFIHKEIFDTQDAIFKICGIESKYIRPPYGAINENLENASDLPLILWNVDTLDWKSRDVEKIKAHIRSNVRDGSIILLHDIYDSSASAIEGVLKDLQAEGYQFVTISELMKYRPEEFE